MLTYAHLCSCVLPARGTSLALDEPEVLRRCGPFAVVLEEVQARSHVGERQRGWVYLRARVSIRQHTSAYVSIRQHTSAYVSIRQHTSAYVSIRQHTSAYVSIRQHTSAYVSIRQSVAGYIYAPAL
jgi:hypothetical protein